MRNDFQDMEPEDLENLLSNYVINSWSYSKVTSFARHEKAWEMNYVWGVYSKKSASSIAGNAYHKSLQYYFTKLKEDGEKIDLVELEQAAFAHIAEVPANQWKLQKTTPTVEESQTDATKTAVALVKNFLSEVGIYENDIAEILDVEIYGDEWVCVNGVEIPLPLHFQIDLVVKTKEGKVAIVDHKSKKSFTDAEELALGIGVQAISYVLGYEAKTGLQVDEVWFVENKYSKNKDGAPQLNRFAIPITPDTRALYEALLYEPLRRMVQAAHDPEYVYLINPSDNFVSLAEIHAFWARTQQAEISIEDFNVDPAKKALVSKRLKKIRDSSSTTVSPTIIKNFLVNTSQFIQYDLSNKNMTYEEKIEHVLRSFGTTVRVAHKFEGYSSNSYLLEVSAGTKISSLYGKRLDIANALDVKNVRLLPELTVHAEKSYVCIEVSKRADKILHFNMEERQGRKIPMGKDNYGNTIYWNTDNPSTPHILVGGSTGSGKTEFLKSTIEFSKDVFDEVYIFDTKYTPEFISLADNMTVFVYNEIEDIEEQMKNLVLEMNQLVASKRRKDILVVFDEFADAMSNARSGKALDVMENVQVGTYAPKKGFMGLMMPGAPKMALKKTGEIKSLEENMRILLQKGRSSGFRIIGATQRASVKVITGDAKVNFPVRVCLNMPTATDSKVMLDEEGAELLAGNGDGLIKSPEYKGTIRFQSFFKAEGAPASQPEAAEV